MNKLFNFIIDLIIDLIINLIIMKKYHTCLTLNKENKLELRYLPNIATELGKLFGDIEIIFNIENTFETHNKIVNHFQQQNSSGKYEKKMKNEIIDYIKQLNKK